MCGGAKYIDPTGKEWKVYFPNPKAALPVVKEDGAIEWVKWGRRREEPAHGFVQGGWARIDSILAGKWAKLNPKPVLLAVQSFMEKDDDRVSHWIDLPEGGAIQGLLAYMQEEVRLYVVTEDTPAEYAWVHDRWPRIITNKKIRGALARSA
jgi:putative SOS response-associated peptidase YedK